LNPGTARADQWINPREAIKDPTIARLQQGRKELTPEEKLDLEKYGFTGLEIMTYLDDNKDPGKDWECFERYLHVGTQGYLKSELYLRRVKYYYPDHRALLTYEGIKPGMIEYKDVSIEIYPPKWKRYSWLSYVYLRAAGKESRFKDEWIYYKDLRRNRRESFTSKEDSWYGTNLTFDDYGFREPWEENHRIIGEDVFKGKSCFVIESKYKLKPDYYLSKRISWVEKENFIDLHEEQFDREGRLYKVIDNQWEQIKPWNYWVKTQRDYWNVINDTRTVFQNFGWIFDQGLSDGLFLPGILRKEMIPKLPDKDLPPLTKPADLPPKPKIRQEFWDKQGINLSWLN